PGEESTLSEKIKPSAMTKKTMIIVASVVASFRTGFRFIGGTLSPAPDQAPL
ncbi:MAG: hypothetical protein HOI02_00170, partial [Rhodospirillaceae bacterium]|nr:hypothetical protein [Rhodospirillaceae bacterium]